MMMPNMWTLMMITTTIMLNLLIMYTYYNNVNKMYMKMQMKKMKW